MLLGVHLTLNKTTIHDAVARAEKLGFSAIALFTGSPLALRRPDPKNFTQLDTHLDVTIHAPYNINPASTAIKNDAKKILLNEVKAAERLDAKRIVIHPGSSTDCSRDEAIFNIREVLSELPYIIDICVETMAGKGNEMCDTLEELAAVIEGLPKHIGICLDTCHLHDAGYDLSNTVEFLNNVKDTIGFERVKIIHVNGSLNPRGSKKDRHTYLRDKFNQIPVSAIRTLVQNVPIQDIPIILERFKTEKSALADLKLLKT